MSWGKVQSLTFIFIETSSSAGVSGNVIRSSFFELDCVGFTCTLVSLGLCCITTSYLKAMPTPSKRFIPFYSTPFFPLSVETELSLRCARVACNAVRLPVLSLLVWHRFLQVLLLIIVVTSLVCAIPPIGLKRTKVSQTRPPMAALDLLRETYLWKASVFLQPFVTSVCIRTVGLLVGRANWGETLCQSLPGLRHFIVVGSCAE